MPENAITSAQIKSPAGTPVRNACSTVLRHRFKLPLAKSQSACHGKANGQPLKQRQIDIHQPPADPLCGDVNGGKPSDHRCAYGRSRSTQVRFPVQWGIRIAKMLALMILLLVIRPHKKPCFIRIRLFAGRICSLHRRHPPDNPQYCPCVQLPRRPAKHAQSGPH